MYPQCSATEEDGPQFSPVLSNHIFPDQLVRLREAGRRMSTVQKLTRETAAFHREAARRHGLNTHRGLLHYKAARAYEAGGQKMLEYFENGPSQSPGAVPLNPKAVLAAHQDAIKFHKKMAEKHGLDSDVGHAHVAMLEHHMNLARQARSPQGQPPQKGPQLQHGGVKGRQSPVPVPKKSEQPSMDVRQNKPPVQIQRASHREARRSRGPLGQIVTEADEGGPGSGRHADAGSHADISPALGKRATQTDEERQEELKSILHGAPGYTDSERAAARILYKGPKPGESRFQPEIWNQASQKKFKDQEASGKKQQQFVAQRYDKSHPEGFKKTY